MKKVLETIDKIGSMLGYDKCGFRLTFPREQAAKEIHEHYMKFVEWLTDGDKIWIDCTGLTPRTVYEIDDKEYTLDEVHQYYCDKILNSKK